MRYLNLITLGCLLLGPTFWKPSGLVLSLVAGFFGGSPTRAKIYFTSSRHSFRYHASTSLLMCGSRGRHLVINSSYHNCISFILNPFLYNIMYPFWSVTSYNGPPFFMVLMWSYHLWSKYTFASMLRHEWMYSSPRYTSRYYHNYCFGEWSTCSKRGLPPFPHHNWWQMDILIIRDSFWNLLDIVIVDPTCTYMVQQASTTTSHVVIMDALEKT
jgi:hypothetical protein